MIQSMHLPQKGPETPQRRHSLGIFSRAEVCPEEAEMESDRVGQTMPANSAANIASFRQENITFRRYRAYTTRCGH